MTTETINGLHSCKPGNDPQVGQIKTFVVQQLTGKSGKPYLKIKSKSVEDGGTPHRILGAQKTDFVDQHGNVSYNLEIEATTMQPSSFQQTKAEMHQQGDWPPDSRYDTPEQAENSPPHAQQGEDSTWRGEDGVTEARKHLMQSANLYNLCVAAVDKAIAPHVPAIVQTSEMFQAAVASLYIEASKDVWWSGKIVKESWLSSMPTTPLIPNGKHSTTAKPIHEIELENQGEVPF